MQRILRLGLQQMRVLRVSNEVFGSGENPRFLFAVSPLVHDRDESDTLAPLHGLSLATET